MGNLDLLEDACDRARLPHTTRAMFGGHGLFAPNGGMFAGIVDEDRIILKLADEAIRTELISLGTKAWVYESKMGRSEMKEWILVPDSFYDEPERLAAWTKRAHMMAPAKSPKKSRKEAGAKTEKKTRGVKDARGR